MTLLLPLPAGAQAGPERQTGVSAVLRDSDGRPIKHRDIAVFAEVHDVHADGTEIIRLERLDTVATGGRGAVVLPRALGKRARELESGRPALRLLSEGEEGVLVRHLELDAAGNIIPDGPVDDVYTSDDPADEQPTAGDGVPGEDQVLELVAGPAEESTEVSILGHTGSPCDFPYYKATSTYTNRWVPIQRSQTMSRSNIRYKWDTTNNTRLEIATGGKWGYHAAGLTASQSNATSVGFSTTLPTSTQRRVEADWRYRRYDVWCTLWTGGETYHGSWEWRPNRLEGNRNINSAGAVSCAAGTRRRHDNETWIARNSTYTVSGSYSIGGVSLKASQTSSSNHELRILPKTTPTYFCGSNDVPLYARMARETTSASTAPGA